MTEDSSEAPRSAGFAALRYDRLAPLYGAISVAFGLRPAVRRAAVEQLALAPGNSVLEVGCGRGDNLELLQKAVGKSGRVVGTEVSAGMLARAEERRRRGGWANVRLLRQAAEQLSVPGCFDAVLFALSYSVLEDRVGSLERAWEPLGDGGRLVVMDAGLPDGRIGRLLEPGMRALSRATVLGDPTARPWRDLRRIGAADVSVRWMAPGTYFVCRGSKLLMPSTSIPPR